MTNRLPTLDNSLSYIALPSRHSRQHMTSRSQTYPNHFVAVALVGVYISMFYWVYLSYLVPVHDYFGFSFNNPGLTIIIAISIMAWAPVVLLPLRIDRPSQLVYWIVYLLAYIPSIITPALIQRQPIHDIMILNASLLLGFLIMGLAYHIPIIPITVTALSPRLFWSVFLSIYIALNAMVLNVFRGHFSIVPFDQIYSDIRFRSIDLPGADHINYVVMLLGNVFNPFLMAYGIVRHKRLTLFFVGSFGQLLLYATGGLKAYVLSIAFMLVFKSVINAKRLRFGHLFPLSLTLLFASINAVHLYLGSRENPAIEMTSSIALMRILGISGLNTAVYHDFFSDNPNTYYTHVKGLSSLFVYPYEQDIGRVVGSYLADDPNSRLNANANMWCTDGIAAMGATGILVASLAFTLVFWALDCVAARHSVKLTALLCVIPAMLITNTSLFTTLWSGGLGLTILVLLALPEPKDRPRHIAN